MWLGLLLCLTSRGFGCMRVYCPTWSGCELKPGDRFSVVVWLFSNEDTAPGLSAVVIGPGPVEGWP